MEYAEALRWLYRQARAGRARTPARAAALLEALGHPERTFPAVHVLGTNGKGSVAAYLEAGLAAAGVAYGVTTSPHLVDFRERVRTDRGLVPAEEVVRFVRWARSRSWEDPPTFFDLVTALAFTHFSARGVALAVVEAGVGGARDATNTLAEVRVTVLTNVGEDHLEALGGTLEAVAWEKAGAVRPGVPVVTGARGVGLEVIREVCRKRGAPLFVLNEAEALFSLPAPPALPGKYQVGNARLAAATLRLLGYPEGVVRRALLEARIRGRMQEVRLGGVRVVLDGGHNPPAAQAVAREFGAYHLVYGAFPRKDARAVLAALLPKARSVRYTSAGPGSLGREVLEALHPAPYLPDPRRALEEAAAAAQRTGDPVLVTGSLYLVGALLAEGLGE